MSARKQEIFVTDPIDHRDLENVWLDRDGAILRKHDIGRRQHHTRITPSAVVPDGQTITLEEWKHQQ